MIHQRQEIREAIANRLKEVQTTAGDNVFTSRAKPLFDQNLPAILVYTTNEKIKKDEWDIDGYGVRERELEISIEAVDTGKDNLDNQLDTLALEIENALDGWNIPNDLSAILRFQDTNSDIAIDGNKIYGAIRLNFQITYRTATNQE